MDDQTKDVGSTPVPGAPVEGWMLREDVVREVLRPVFTGVLGGLIAAFWLSKFIASQLFQATPHDPLTFGASVAFLVAVCALAAVVLLRRATHIDPVVALRAE